MFAFPQLPELFTRWRAAFASKGALDAATPFNNVSVTAAVMSAGQAEDFLRLDYVGRQAFAATAEGRFLDRHAAQYGLTRRPAAGAGGNVKVTASAALTLPAGTIFTRGDGWVYSAVNAAEMTASGAVSVPVAAVSNPPFDPASSVDGTGVLGDCAAGVPLTLGPQATGPGAAGATAQADAGGIVGGMDVEQDGEAYTSDLSTLRGRLLFRLRNPPAGGNPADYVQWASRVPGVTRVFIERRWRGPGSVRVFPLFDGLFPGGAADAPRIEAVRQIIELEAPATAVVTVMAPALLPIDVTIDGLEPQTAAVRAAVRAEIEDAFFRLSRVSGSDLELESLPYLAWPTSFAASWIWQAAANASGSRRFTLTLPADDIVIPPGAIPVLGTLFFS